MESLSPLEQHKADLEMIIAACGVADVNSCRRIARLAEALLVRLPEESHCVNHGSTQICPDCTFQPIARPSADDLRDRQNEGRSLRESGDES